MCLGRHAILKEYVLDMVLKESKDEATHRRTQWYTFITLKVIYKLYKVAKGQLDEDV